MGIFKLLFAVYIIRTFVTFISKNLDKETLSFPGKTNLYLNMDAFNKKSTNSSQTSLPNNFQDINPTEDSALLRDPDFISSLTWLCPHFTEITVNTVCKALGYMWPPKFKRRTKRVLFFSDKKQFCVCFLGGTTEAILSGDNVGDINLFSSKLLFRKSYLVPCGTPWAVLCLMAMSHSALSLWVGDVLVQLLKVVMLFTVKSLLSPDQLFLKWQLWS